MRARYFFAMDPSDPWVMKLFSNSVVVIHAGWIVNCIEEAFVVPITEYILDDMFIPELPYKPTTNTYGVYVPLSERDNYIGTQPGPIPVQTSDTPSTPTSTPRKRRQEQAYFDSPSGSFVFSAFDKDGLPRRPRKLRKLRFDPFSPEGGKLGSETMQVPGLVWFEDLQDSQLDKGHGQRANACFLPMNHMLRTPDTPDKPLTNKEPMVPHRHFPTCDRLLDTTGLSPSATSVDIQKKIPMAPIRTIDFTNPSHTRRRFPEAAKTTKSRDTGTLLSITRLTENEVKTPKKISFADHARVFVYPVSPQPLDAKDSTTSGSAQQRLEANYKTLGKKVESYAKPTAMTKDLAPQPRSLEIKDEDPTRCLGGDQLENDTLTLTMEDVDAIRCRLLELATANGVDDGQLATMFELGKTFRGGAFQHVW